MSGEWIVLTRSPDETFAIGEVLGRHVRPGDLIALCGALGAGKTQFVKGVARGLGVPEDEPVVSPTFVLVREYAGRLPLYHIDAYRLSGGDDLAALGFDEMRGERGGVVALEWADRAAEHVTHAAVRAELSHVDDETRRIELEFADAAWGAAIIAELPSGLVQSG